MKYSEFRADALKTWKELPEEQNEMYKHHYLSLADEIAAIKSEPVDEMEEKAVLQSLAEQAESQTGARIDALVSAGAFVSGSKFVRLLTEEDIANRLISKLHTNSEDKLVSLVHASSTRNILVEVPAGEHATINMLILAHASPLYSQIFVQLGENSTLNLLELCLSGQNAQLFALLQEVSIGKDSKAEINIIRNESMQTLALNFYKSKAAENAHIKTNIMYNGGCKVKSKNSAVCSGTASMSEINESILSIGTQKFDLYTYMVNDAQKSVCHSETKAVLTGKSYGYVKGFAKIKKGAIDSRSYVEERGLILDKGAYINLIPDMSIDENEVKATHSGASAPIDKDSLFYMMSRGADFSTSRKLIINGFFGEILSKMESNESKRLALALMHDKISNGVFGHIPKIDMGELWISETHGEQELFGGHYKYR
jgi:Fe-S cluster assembly scaffold protein SufB